MKTAKSIIVVLFVLLTAQIASAYYCPSTGRWLSRDPIGEPGFQALQIASLPPQLPARWINRDPIGAEDELNLYEYTDNSSIDIVDVLGLDSLTYSSDGEYYFNGFPLSYTSNGDSSGVQNSPEAWFWQIGQEQTCHGGLCNSGGTGTSSSFITATVKNTGKCPLNVTCNCNVHWSGMTVTRGHTGGFISKGNVLGTAFYKYYKPAENTSGVSTASGTATKSVGLTFQLSPGTSKELYNAYISVAIPPDMPGTYFAASMKGSCSCSSK